MKRGHRQPCQSLTTLGTGSSHLLRWGCPHTDSCRDQKLCLYPLAAVPPTPFLPTPPQETQTRGKDKVTQWVLDKLEKLHPSHSLSTEYPLASQAFPKHQAQGFLQSPLPGRRRPALPRSPLPLVLTGARPGKYSHEDGKTQGYEVGGSPRGSAQSMIDVRLGLHRQGHDQPGQWLQPESIAAQARIRCHCPPLTREWRNITLFQEVMMDGNSTAPRPATGLITT